MRRVLDVALVSLLAIACSGSNGDPRDQWIVTLSTDAPLPAVADRLLIEIVRSDGALACGGCRRQLGAAPDAWPISFGVLPPSNAETLRIRVRLFRASSAGQDGLPTPDALLIDALGSLPGADGVTPVSVELRMSCFGIASDVIGDITCNPETGTLRASPRLAAPSSDLPKVGSWPPAISRPCQGEVPDGMACVEGGVFVLGRSREPDFYLASSRFERLVRLDPFAMDKREVRIGEVRELMLSGEILGSPTPFVPNPTSFHYPCRFLGLDDDANDAMPVNCISQSTADSVCRARGGRLPTEAEWEFAASNRGTERVYPWGDDGNVCARAMVGRGPGLISGFFNDDSCQGDEPPKGVPGPLADGYEGDVNELGLHDMGGNVSEWTLDELEEYNAPCWHPEQTLLENPLCEGTDAVFSTVRGGTWGLPPLTARLRQRPGAQEPGDMFVGMRCVVPMP